MKFKMIASWSVFSLSLAAHAGPSFTSITETDFENITKEMSANFTHNSLMGASKLGTIFGFQVGLVGAQTASPKSDEIAKRTSGSDLANLYNMGLMAAVGIPFGVSAEAVIIPKMTSSDASINATSLGLKINMNELIPVLPINLAFRGIYSTAKFSFSQTISSSTASVENSTTVSGLQMLLSPMIPIVEPYVGIGALSGKNELSVTGTTGTVFDSSFTSSQSSSKTVSTVQYLAGVEVNLLVLKLGAEYSQQFGTSRTGIKLSFGF